MFKSCIMGVTMFMALNAFSGTVPSKPASESSIIAYTQLSATGELSIKGQPSDQVDCKGNKATFAVDIAGGSGSIHYLWKRKRPTDATFTTFGARDSTKLPVYNIGVGSEAPNGTLYQVTVSDQNNMVVSNSAMLTVNQITGIAPVGVATYTLNQGGNLWFKVLTDGNTPTAFQWIKKYGSSDWRDLTDNAVISGSQREQLNFTGISVADSGIYKLRVTYPTLNGNQCIETSTITRKIIVIRAVDTEPPHFINLSDENRILCMKDLEQAEWNSSTADILPFRLNYYQIDKNSFQFNLTTIHFSDNITPAEDLILHWGIFSNGLEANPIVDEAGTLLVNQPGQISIHPENIRLEKPGSESAFIQIIFWLEDQAGNLTPALQRHRINLSVMQRPQIISDF